MQLYNGSVGIFDLLYPKRCVGCKKTGIYFCASCQAGSRLHFPQVCPVCERASADGVTHKRCKKRSAPDGLTALWAYEGTPRKLILKLKYKFVSDIAECCVTIVANLLENLHQSTPDAPKWGVDEFCIVPIPLYWTRENWRGFNHAEELAKLLAKEMDWQFANLLIRKKLTSPQVGLKEKDRKKNIEGAFSIDGRLTIQPFSHVVLFDDVWTTGATMKEACRVLKKAGVKSVWCLTLAR